MLDILIKDVNIIDGSGTPAYKADIAIRGDKILNIGEINEPSIKIIEAQGLSVNSWIY